MFKKGNEPPCPFPKGNIPWNKGRKGLQVAWNKGKHLSEETRRKLSEAKIGLYDGEKNPRYLHPDLTHTPTLAYILGVMKGDGTTYQSSKTHHSAIVLGVTDRMFAQSFYEALEKISLHPRLAYLSKERINWYNRNTKSYIQSKKGRWFVSAYSQAFVNWYKSLSLEDIEHIVSSSKENTSSFIRGFYESEGSIQFNNKGRRLRIFNTDKSLIYLIVKLMRHLNFQSTIYTDHRTRLGINYTIYTLWLLGGRNEVIKFIRTIKPCIKNNLADDFLGGSK